VGVAYLCVRARVPTGIPDAAVLEFADD
jgi:hypothetical protein